MVRRNCKAKGYLPCGNLRSIFRLRKSLTLSARLLLSSIYLSIFFALPLCSVFQSLSLSIYLFLCRPLTLVGVQRLIFTFGNFKSLKESNVSKFLATRQLTLWYRLGAQEIGSHLVDRANRGLQVARYTTSRWR